MTTLARWAQILTAWGLPIALLIGAFAVWWDQTSLGLASNHLVYDHFLDFDSRFSHVPAEVLVIYTDAELEGSADSYFTLLAKIQELGPRGLGIANVDVRGWSIKNVRRLADTGVSLGQVRRNQAQRTVTLDTAPVPWVHHADGVYRYSLGSSALGHDTWISRLARKHGRERVAPRGAFGVRFRGGDESLPHVRAKVVLKGNLTPALVRDRVVVVGRQEAVFAPGVGDTHDGCRSNVVIGVHANALNTLLTGSEIRSVPMRWRLPIYLAIAVLFLVFGRWVRLHQLLPFVASIWVLQSLVVLFVLWFLKLWVPLVSLMLIQLAASLYSCDQRMRFTEHAWQMLRRRGFNVSPRYKSHPSISADSAPWDYVATFLQQLFPLECIAVLVADGNREHLRLATTLGCGEEDIVERRRDIRRSPYSAALEKKAAVQIADGTRSFFVNSEQQCEYVCPLFYGGRLKAVIAVELSAAARARVPGFAERLTEACDEIAPWFARYEELDSRSRSERRWWNRWGNHAESETYERLQRHLRLIERRLHQSFAVIEYANTGKAVFDLTGTLLTINASMFRILQGFGVASMDARLLEVLRALTQRDLQACRDLVERSLVAGRCERLIVPIPVRNAPIYLSCSRLPDPRRWSPTSRTWMPSMLLECNWNFLKPIC